MPLKSHTSKYKVTAKKNNPFSFAVDGGRLLITIKGEESPHLLSANTTHALLNLLFTNRADILAESCGYVRRSGIIDDI